MNTLKERLEEVMREHDLKTQQQLADFTGVSKGLVGQWFSGATGLGKKPLLALEKKTRFSPQWLADGMGNKYKETQAEPSNVGEQGEFMVWNRFSDLPKDEWALIPFYRDTKISAGDGVAHQVDNNNFRLPFSRATLNRLNINPDHVVCHNVLGKSMHPLLPEHTTIGINLDDTIIREGKIYAFKHKGLLKVKLLHPLSDSEVRIQSANSDKVSFPDDVANLADIEMLGRVFWWSVLD